MKPWPALLSEHPARSTLGSPAGWNTGTLTAPSTDQWSSQFPSLSSAHTPGRPTSSRLRWSSPHAYSTQLGRTLFPTFRTSRRKSWNKGTLLTVFFVFTFLCLWMKLNNSSSEIPAKRTSEALPLTAIATLLRFVVVWVHPFMPSLGRGKSSPIAAK